jgi:prepilin-type N-terminal cleavage/methylation domain-containing protein
MKKTSYSGYEKQSGLSHNCHPRRAFTLVELMVVILILGLLMAFLAPSLAVALKQGYRGKCKMNLRELARSCRSYASDATLHRGSASYALPVTPGLNTTNWGSLTVGNTAALWQLIDSGFAGRSLFYCPEAGPHRGFDKPAVDDNDFTATTSSYSYLSMVVVDYRTALGKDDPSLVILADQNPRCTPGVTGVPAINNNKNSANHGGDGQNVVHLDTSAKWIESPDGDGDDIYAADGADAGVIATNELNGWRNSRGDIFVIP